MGVRYVRFLDVIAWEEAGALVGEGLALRDDSTAIPLLIHCKECIRNGTRSIMEEREKDSPSSSITMVSPALKARSSPSCGSRLSQSHAVPTS